MQILYHHRTLADGAEGIHIAAMVDAFRKLGHGVVVQGLAEPSGRTSWQSAALSIRGLLPAAAFELASVALNVLEYRRVRKEIRHFSPHLLYKRHARYDVGALVAARRAGVPSVLEVNSLFTQGPYYEFEPLKLRPVAVRLECHALELATVIVAVSTPLARQIEALGGRKALVLPNGADPERFDPARANPHTVRLRHRLPETPIIGWSGILRNWHGLDLLLEAAVAIPEAQLLIVGNGPAQPAVERRAAELKLSDRTVITGRVAHADMPDYIAAMDIAVVADERTGVASPMKLLEYMAMGRAVVAPRLENIGDLITDAVNGLLFTPGDSQDLGRALRRAIDSRELRNTLGREARTRVEVQRNWQANAKSLLEALRSNLGPLS